MFITNHFAKNAYQYIGLNLYHNLIKNSFRNKKINNKANLTLFASFRDYLRQYSMFVSYSQRELRASNLFRIQTRLYTIYYLGRWYFGSSYNFISRTYLPKHSFLSTKHVFGHNIQMLFSFHFTTCKTLQKHLGLDE